MVERLHLHVLDICVANRHNPDSLSAQIKAAKSFVGGSKGRAVLCTTFDPFKFSDAAFQKEAIEQLNNDFADGAVAVKIWKTWDGAQGLERGIRHARQSNRCIRTSPSVAKPFSPIWRNQTHAGSQPPNKNSPDYSYYQEHPEWYMYTKPDHPSKRAILETRDDILERNPQLRVVGAHLGSMESNLDELERHLNRYPNFAVDTGGRVIYFGLQPRDKARKFLIDHQDRILYATDLQFYGRQNIQQDIAAWQSTYLTDWRFLSIDAMVDVEGHRVRGLQLPQEVLRKLYHDNAIRWIPGILSGSP